MDDNRTQKELVLTQEFTKWYKGKGYFEFYDDLETSGADPFDSTGILGDDLIFIEFKYRISPRMVFYANATGSSIEKKIATLLKLVYNKENSQMYTSVKEHYTDFTRPKLIIVANAISKIALNELDILFKHLSYIWRFSYEVIIWNSDKEANVVLSGNIDNTNNTDNRKINIPDYPSTAKTRPPKLTLEGARNKMKKKGLIDEFEMLTKYFADKGGKIVFTQNNLNFKFTQSTIGGIWPEESSKSKGIMFTIFLDGLNNELKTKFKAISEMGLVRNNTKIGTMGYNVFIKNKKEIKQLIEKIENWS